MIKFQTISGVSIDSANSLPKIHRTPEGRAMASVPGWALLCDPDYASVSDGSVRNRAAPSSVFKSASSSPGLDSFPNGASAFAPTEGPWNWLGSVKVDPERWSAFFVCMPNYRDVPRAQRPLRADPEIEGSISISIGFSASDGENVIVYEYGTASGGPPTRLAYNGAFLHARSTPSLIMVTFSVERGLAIYDGGQLVASDPSDTRPLDALYDTTDNIRVLQECRGRYGMIGLLNIDLGAPENTGHRRAIERFLMDKYGIPEGPQ